jgi:hypothetical protein
MTCSCLVENDVLAIGVLGSGCPNCRKVEEISRRAAATLGLQAESIKITDYAKIMEYPILGATGLVVDKKVVRNDSIPGEAEETSWPTSALEQT